MSSFDHLSEALWEIAAEEASLASPEWVARKVAALRGILTEKQLDLIDDPCRFKSVLCGRRAGKTTAFAVKILVFCLKRPEALCAYVTMTRGVAKRNIWGMLRKLNDTYELQIKFNNTELSGKLPNGSSFFLSGADNIGEIDKLRGIPLDLVIMDEAKSFPSGLFYELVDEVLRPTLADRLGHMAVGGTPGAILAGPFYDATCALAQRPGGFKNAQGNVTVSRPYWARENPEWAGQPFEWSFHTWLSKDNTAVPHLWEEQNNEKLRKGWTDDAPVWRREYLAEWVADDRGLVYRYLAERNDWTPDPESDNPFGLPDGHEWHYILGVDLGYEDDTSFEVGAYSDTHPHFFEVYDVTAPHMTVADMARNIRELESKFGGFEIMVGDAGGLGRTIFEELAETYGIALEIAKKKDKRDHIEILNSNLVSGLVKIRPGSRLAWQMTYLQWDEDQKHEDPAFPNHNCDAFLYLIRRSMHTQAHELMRLPQKGSQDWWEAEMQREEQRLEEAAEGPPPEDVVFYDEDQDFEQLEAVKREMRREWMS